MVAGPDSQFSPLRPSSFGEVFGAHRSVDAAIDRPVERFAYDVALDGRASYRRQQKATLARLTLHRMRGKREVQHGKSVEKKFAMVDLCIAADVHYNLVRLELPLGMR